MNFFDAMGLADKERIHSQFLFWFFRLEKNIVPDEVKRDFLITFLNDDDCGYKDFYSYTEKSNIDIIITSDKMALIIENKLKSSQHSKQTFKYDEIFNELCVEYPEFKREKTIKVLLSLIDERPESPEWIPITFHKLHEAFESIMPKLNNDVPEVIIINEYIKSIKKLIDTYDYFLKNYYNFPQVFEKDKKSNIKEAENNEYIKNLGLRIIYQKGFYTKTMEIIEQSYKNNIFPYKNKEFPEWRVGEERGDALIQIIFEYYFEKKYFLGIQYQGNSFKFNYQSSDYKKSTTDEAEIKYGITAFKEYMKNNNTIFKKINLPTKHALISLSKKVDKFEYSSFEDFCDRFNEEIILAIPIIESLHSILSSN
jgi:hypothetical protein